MKLFKKTKLFVSLLSLPILASVSYGLVSCGESVVNHSITWEYDKDKVSVTVSEGELPTTFAEGEELTFTVTPSKGYEILRVSKNGTRISGRNGTYTTVIEEDSTISITLEEVISGLTITKDPDKLDYLDGEEVDVTGMEVTVNYETGRSEEIEYGGSNGYSVSPSTLSGGDTSFRVVYEDVSATVELNDVVQFRVSVGFSGATVAEEYKTYLEGLNLDNFTYEDTVGFTFTYYNSLPEEGVLLPTVEQMTRENSNFINWSGATDGKITNDSGSVEITANWEYNLVIPESINFEVVEGVPYLVFNGQFGIDDVSLSLYLYEGNDDVELRTEQIVSGKAGDDFTYRFDLRELSGHNEGAYKGKWMDIKFLAEIGDREEVQDIRVGEIEVDLNNKIRAGGYTYRFETYTAGGVTSLKVVFEENYYTYNISFSTEENITYLDINGTVSREEYYGKYLEISWYQNGNGEFNQAGSLINATDGTFKVSVDLSKFNFGNMGYAHVTIRESEDSTSAILFGGTNTNLASGDCLTAFNPFEERVGELSSGITTNNGDIHYFVGSSNGLALYVVDDSRDMGVSSITLSENEGVVYYNLTLSYRGYEESYMVNPWLDFQTVNGDWARHSLGRAGDENSTIIVDSKADENLVTFSIPVSNNSSILNAVGDAGACFMGHYSYKDTQPAGDGDWTNSEIATFDSTSITNNGYVFKLVGQAEAGVNWGNAFLNITKAA